MKIKDSREVSIIWSDLYENLKKYIAEDVETYRDDFRDREDLINVILDDLYLNTDADWIVLGKNHNISDLDNAQMLVDEELYDLISYIVDKKLKGRDIYDSKKVIRRYNKKSRY